MARLNVSMPDALKAWAMSRVGEGRWNSVSAYVRDLIQRDQEDEEARRRFDAKGSFLNP